LPGVDVSGTTFTPRAPTDGKYDGVELRGIRLHVTDRARYDPTKTAVALLAAIRAVQRDSLRFNERSFDRLAAGSELRRALVAGAKIHWGGFLLLFSGVFDMVDGRVAREGSMTTTFGAFYDSTLDRVGEAALFTGIAVYFLRGGVPPERLTAAVLACFVALAASLLVSYTRARAEG